MPLQRTVRGEIAFDRRMITTEAIVGRGLAYCLNPRAAWRVTSNSGRALVVLAYGIAGFVVTLAALVLLA